MTPKSLQNNLQKHTVVFSKTKAGRTTVFDHSPHLIRLSVKGQNLTNLIQEAGGHRVQRVPPTEKKGRVHTSSVTVAVTDPNATNQDTKYHRRSESDFRVDWFSGTGKGGQHRNKKQCSCRVTHIPTGIVEVRQGRSRENNMSDALQSINSQLDDLIKRQVRCERDAITKQQIGSGDRGSWIRSYCFQHGHVTDKQSGKQITTKQFTKGMVDLLWK